MTMLELPVVALADLARFAKAIEVELLRKRERRVGGDGDGRVRCDSKDSSVRVGLCGWEMRGSVHLATHRNRLSQTLTFPQ